MNLKRVSFLFLFLLICTEQGCAQNKLKEEGWNKLDEILTHIVEPVFPSNEFDITTYGAIGDGFTDCSEAIIHAINDCSELGGGKVIVPNGTYLTGAIYLKSNVNLFVSENAVIKFSEDKSKYLPVVFTRWEGVECFNYSPLIYSYQETNIAVTGNGILDGQGSNNNWWDWKGNKNYGWTEGSPNQKNDRDHLFELAEDNVPREERIFGESHYLRPSFLQPYKCKNILIEGITLKNSPMWFIHPVLCENVTVKNITVEGLGPNNDGCNPESSKYVLIKNCYFNTGDDCIAIKSGRNNDGRRINIPSENIIIQNCTMKEGHGGVVIGSEISGGVRDVFADNCVMNSPNLDRAIRIKTNAVRGGLIENLFVRNITVGEVKEAVLKINFYYEEGEDGNFLPVVRNINLSNVTSEKSKYAIWIKAFENSPAENINLEQCVFKNVEKDNLIENVKSLKAKSVIINGKPISIE